MGKRLKNHRFDIPPPKQLPGTDEIVPHVIVGDEAFALHENLMKPYPRPQALIDVEKAIFNYRLFRARRIVENAFGILSAQFRIFFTLIEAMPETMDNMIITACILHNLMRKRSEPTEYAREDAINEMDNNIASICDTFGRTRDAPMEIRDKFKSYFNREGAVEWQRNSIGIN